MGNILSALPLRKHRWNSVNNSDKIWRGKLKTKTLKKGTQLYLHMPGFSTRVSSAFQMEKHLQQWCKNYWSHIMELPRALRIFFGFCNLTAFLSLDEIILTLLSSNIYWNISKMLLFLLITHLTSSKQS